MKTKFTSWLLVTFLFISPNMIKAQVNVQDSLALVDFYKSTHGANWTFNSGWLTSAPVNAWAGVTVSDGRVTGIHLKGNHLTGSIPFTIGNLTELKSLYLYNNKIRDSL